MFNLKFFKVWYNVNVVGDISTKTPQNKYKKGYFSQKFL